ncbi:MAG: F0F1 ATP synthase subunit alpha, partial [Planctomycetota bacterium]|nr:F0F1 ATP synthase subunit alpha [Planctomycetota bacterium]
QIKAMKKISGSLRLDLSAFRELEAFAQLGTELDKATQAQLDRGFRIVEILKQSQYKPMPISEQVVIIWCGSSGNLDALPVNSLADFEEQFLEHIRTEFPEILESITSTGEISDDMETKLTSAVTNFRNDFAAKLPQ